MFTVLKTTSQYFLLLNHKYFWREKSILNRSINIWYQLDILTFGLSSFKCLIEPSNDVISYSGNPPTDNHTFPIIIKKLHISGLSNFRIYLFRYIWQRKTFKQIPQMQHHPHTTVRMWQPWFLKRESYTCYSGWVLFIGVCP